MINEILVRYYTPELSEKAAALACLINDETEYSVKVIDHSKLKLEDFKKDDGDWYFISIDKHLADKFEIPFMQVSRIFNIHGEIIGNKILYPKQSSIIDPDRICIIDTDMCKGNAITTACNTLGIYNYSIQLRVQPDQDLIDVEDLIYDISLLNDTSHCSYMINPEFFTKRTSLPIELYDKVSSILNTNGS